MYIAVIYYVYGRYMVGIYSSWTWTRQVSGVMEVSDVKRQGLADSGRVEPKTRTDSEAKTRKSRFQVQVDSLELLPS